MVVVVNAVNGRHGSKQIANFEGRASWELEKQKKNSSDSEDTAGWGDYGCQDDGGGDGMKLGLKDDDGDRDSVKFRVAVFSVDFSA
jgi:hypothetical protein